MDGLDDLKFNCTRRHFLSAASLGIGSTALAALLDPSLLAAAPASQGAAGPAGAPLLSSPHLVPRVKRVIYLFQSGGPSQLELFDYKPRLRTMNGEELPESIRKGQRLTGMTAHQKSFPMAGSQFDFARHGKSGTWVSELLPHTARIVDKLCIVRSMHTEAINHDPAVTFFQTGSQQAGRPSIGAWLSYGLGSENANLPGFIVLLSRAREGDQPLYSWLWGSGFLPSQHQGVQFRGGKDPVLFLNDPEGHRSHQPPADARHAAHARAAAARAHHGSGDRRAHRPVRDGLPHADGGARRHGSLDGVRRRLRAVRRRRPASPAPTPPTACWRGAWPSATCASSSSITRAGTSTATCRTTSAR